MDTSIPALLAMGMRRLFRASQRSWPNFFKALLTGKWVLFLISLFNVYNISLYKPYRIELQTLIKHTLLQKKL